VDSATIANSTIAFNQVNGPACECGLFRGRVDRELAASRKLDHRDEHVRHERDAG
jgi:hypothetical protein